MVQLEQYETKEQSPFGKHIDAVFAEAIQRAKTPEEAEKALDLAKNTLTTEVTQDTQKQLHSPDLAVAQEHATGGPKSGYEDYIKTEDDRFINNKIIRLMSVLDDNQKRIYDKGRYPLSSRYLDQQRGNAKEGFFTFTIEDRFDAGYEVTVKDGKDTYVMKIGIDMDMGQEFYLTTTKNNKILPKADAQKATTKYISML